MRTLLGLLLALLPLGLSAQEVKLPATVAGPVGAFIVINAETADPLVRWHSIDAGLNLFPPQLLKDSKLAVVTALVPGRYRLLAVSAKDGVPSEFAQCLIVIGDAPVPVPPGPTPVPVPPLPTPAGPRGLTIIRETADSSPAMGRLITGLRAGPSAQYLASKQHRLDVLDDDAVGSDGRPTPAVEVWRSIFAGLKLPVLIMYDPVTRSVIAKAELAPSATAESVVAFLKANGG